jgi:hypothetical protein
MDMYANNLLINAQAVNEAADSVGMCLSLDDLCVKSMDNGVFEWLLYSTARQ